MKDRLITLKRIIEKEVGFRIDTKGRKRQVTYARAVFCKIARDLNDSDRSITYKRIGDLIDRDHVSVLHNIKVIFPFSQQEKEYRLLYEAVSAMFIFDEKKENFDERKEIAERLIELEKENQALKHKLLLIAREGSRFDKMTDGLASEELEEIYEKLDIMVRAIRNRVYI